LAGKWIPYTKLVKEYVKEEGREEGLQYLTQETKKTAEGKALDDLGVTKQCCRRHMLTHVDLI
jgi:DNA-directed RNA polymerase I, II, and III subunit RPABC5